MNLRKLKKTQLNFIYGLALGISIGLIIGLPLAIDLPRQDTDTGDVWDEIEETPQPPQPPVTEPEIITKGFSGFQVDSSSTELRNGILLIRFTNANSGVVNVKKATASYLDYSVENSTQLGIVPVGNSFTYALDFKDFLGEGAFWIDVDILYTLYSTNEFSRGSVIRGLDAAQISQCEGSSFEIFSYNYLVGSGLLRVGLLNSNTRDLTIDTYIRGSDGALTSPIDPFSLGSGEYKTIEISRVTRLMESLIFVSSQCPGTSQVLLIEDISGL